MRDGTPEVALPHWANKTQENPSLLLIIGKSCNRQVCKSTQLQKFLLCRAI